MGNLVFQATLGGQVNLVGPNTASTFNLNVPAVAGTLVTTGDTGTVTNTMLAGSIANAKLTNSSVTVGSTSIALGATSTTLAGLTGVTTSALTDSGLTSGRVTYASTGGLLADSANLTFNGTTLTTANDASISGLTVGKGGSAVSTNTALGYQALTANTSGDRNVAVGYQSAVANTTGINTSVGYQSLATNTTGTENTAVGFLSLNKNTTGNYNSGLSDQALYNNTTGSYNVAVGMQALQANTTASNNTAVGYQAGYSNTTGTKNLSVGYQAGYTVTTGGYNTLIGSGGAAASSSAGYSLTTANNNTFIGYSAGSAVTTGSSNTIIGAYGGNQGGLDIRTSSNYIVLSDGDGNPREVIDGSGNWFLGATGLTGLPSASNQGFGYDSVNAYIKTSRNGTGSLIHHQFFNPNGAVGSISTTASATVYAVSSDERLKEDKGIAIDTSVIDKTIVHDFAWKIDGSIDKGVFAQEAKLVKPSAVIEGSDEIGENGLPVNPWGVDYSKYVPELIVYCQQLNKTIQELKTIVDAQAAEIAELKAKVGL